MGETTDPAGTGGRRGKEIKNLASLSPHPLLSDLLWGGGPAMSGAPHGCGATVTLHTDVPTPSNLGLTRRALLMLGRMVMQNYKKDLHCFHAGCQFSLPTMFLNFSSEK